MRPRTLTAAAVLVVGLSLSGATSVPPKGVVGAVTAGIPSPSP